MDTGTEITKNTLKDWIMATVRFSQQQHGWWQALSSYTCTRPGRTVADMRTPPPSPGQPVWLGGREKLVEPVKAVSVDESSGTDFQC